MRPLHLLMGGVYEKYIGNKITENLAKFHKEICRKNNINYIIAEATGSISQNIFKKLKYETLYSIKYKEFKFKGSNIYSNITDCETCDLIFKNLKNE